MDEETREEQLDGEQEEDVEGHIWMKMSHDEADEDDLDRSAGKK